MIRDYFEDARSLGLMLLFCSEQEPQGREAIGLIQPMDEREGDFLLPTRAGRADSRRYLLLCEPAAIKEGETGLTVTSDGREYELLRAEAVRIGSHIGHWEGVLKLKGGAT